MITFRTLMGFVFIPAITHLDHMSKYKKYDPTEIDRVAHRALDWAIGSWGCEAGRNDKMWRALVLSRLGSLAVDMGEGELNEIPSEAAHDFNEMPIAYGRTEVDVSGTAFYILSTYDSGLLFTRCVIRDYRYNQEGNPHAGFTPNDVAAMEQVVINTLNNNTELKNELSENA